MAKSKYSKNGKNHSNKKSKSKYKDDFDKKDVLDKDKNKTSCSYDNDAMWYGLTEQILAQFDSMSFDDVIGIPPHLSAHPTDAAPYNDLVYLGAVMSIELFPTIGYQGAPQAPYAYRTAVGDASQRIYTILSAANGKTTKYLPEDPALVILMLGNITAMSACYWRLVGIRNLFSPRNRLVPNNLIEAMGFQSANFLKKISNSMERYNNIVARLNGISMFADIPYFTKCNEIFSHIFFDKNSAMGQYYVTKPAGWFRYTDGAFNEETGFFEGNKLTYVPWEGLLDIDDFLDVMEHQVNDMLQSSLFNYVYSDVIREIRRNGGQVYQFNLIDNNYVRLPEFSEVFMTQVHNMSWGIITDLSSYEITDNVDTMDLEDNLDYTVDPTSLRKFHCGAQIMDFPYTDDPDYKLVAEALAYKFMADGLVTQGANIGSLMHVAVPDHAVYKVYMYTVHAVSGAITKREVPYVTNKTGYAELVVQGYENFDIRPINKVSNDSATSGLIVGDLNFFTTITVDKLENIFRQAFIKLFSSETFNSAAITTVNTK